MIFEARMLTHGILFAYFLQSVFTAKQLKACSFRILQYDYNPIYIANYLVEANKEGNEISMEFTLIKTLADDFRSELTIQRCERKNAKKCNTIFTYDVGVCTVLGKERGYQINMIQIWLKNLMKYGNLPRSCPILNDTYYWRGLKVERGSIPTFILNGPYRLHALTYNVKNNNMKDMVSNTTAILEIKMK